MEINNRILWTLSAPIPRRKHTKLQGIKGVSRRSSFALRDEFFSSEIVIISRRCRKFFENEKLRLQMF